ncbi:MAG: hypothetical protein V1834_01905 [Candidatus Micrarchaeota archaeon]
MFNKGFNKVTIIVLMVVIIAIVLAALYFSGNLGLPGQPVGPLTPETVGLPPALPG